MPAIKFSGPMFYRLTSFLALNRIAIGTIARHAMGRKIEPSWDTNLEIGVRFTRHQFTRAMQAADIRQGRLILDSLQTETPDDYAVKISTQASPKGSWYIPRNRTNAATVLYFHGGGYAFYGAMSRRFAAMLAHHIGAPVFAPDYRLTPENPHPAQGDDAHTAWNFIVAKKNPKQVVVIGDSAGGHMMLTLLRELAEKRCSQPALGIGLCPWTDIGERGKSLHENDFYDLVQGWMALQFGQWLDPNGSVGRSVLSPISYDYSDTAPLYIQTGGREILHDMVCEFALKQEKLGANLLLDVWPTMPHDFQLMDSKQAASTEALKRITSAVSFAMKERATLPSVARTVLASGIFAVPDSL